MRTIEKKNIYKDFPWIGTKKQNQSGLRKGYVNFYFETFQSKFCFCKHLVYMSSEINEFRGNSMDFHIIETLNLSHLMV